MTPTDQLATALAKELRLDEIALLKLKLACMEAEHLGYQKGMQEMQKISERVIEDGLNKRRVA